MCRWKKKNLNEYFYPGWINRLTARVLSQKIG